MHASTTWLPRDPVIHPLTQQVMASYVPGPRSHMVTTTDLISALAELGSWEACRERQKWGPREMRHPGALSIWEMWDRVTEPSPWLATCPSRWTLGRKPQG